MVNGTTTRLGRKGSTPWRNGSVFIILSFVMITSWHHTSIIIDTYTNTGMNYTFSPPLSDKKQTCKPIQASMVLFGVPKMFKYILKSYVRNVIEQNPHVDFSVHLHMYHDLLTVNTPRNGEQGTPAESKSMTCPSMPQAGHPVPGNQQTPNCHSPYLQGQQLVCCPPEDIHFRSRYPYVEMYQRSLFLAIQPKTPIGQIWP